jgi:apolipoprotein N-acyltransferase
VLAASAPGTDLVLGGPHYRNAEPSPDYFTSVFLVRGGRVAGRYDKQRLVPFAEYAPFGARLPATTPQMRVGERVLPLETSAARIGAFLCGEVLFPEVARALSLAGATVLANPSNDAWFGAEAPARHQLRAAAFRAIENRRPLVRPATGGYSAIVDAHGETIAVSAPDGPALLEARIQPSAAKTPYQRAGFALAPGALGLMFAVSLPRWRRRVHGGKP